MIIFHNVVRLSAQSRVDLYEPCAVQDTHKDPGKKVNNGLRKSNNDFKVANVVKNIGDRKENVI